MHEYVSYYGDGVDRVYTSQGLVADQLSVERGVNALFELANGFTPEERPSFWRYMTIFFFSAWPPSWYSLKFISSGKALQKKIMKLAPCTSIHSSLSQKNINFTQIKTNHYYLCLTPIFRARSVLFFRAVTAAWMILHLQSRMPCLLFLETNQHFVGSAHVVGLCFPKVLMYLDFCFWTSAVNVLLKSNWHLGLWNKETNAGALYK